MNWQELEKNCIQSSKDYVAKLMENPEDLEKIDQLIQKHTKLANTADLMLKTAVQSQLDGVRSGLEQLEKSVGTVDAIHKNFVTLNRIYGKIGGLSKDLEPLKVENHRHVNLKNSKNNLEQMINAPRCIMEVTEMMSPDNVSDNLLEISDKLFRIEQVRHDILLEMHRKSKEEDSEYSYNQGYIVIESYFKEISKIYDNLWAHLAVIFENYNDQIITDSAKFVTAVRIVEKESVYDESVEKMKETTGFSLSTRPLLWREKMFKHIKQVISSKIFESYRLRFNDRSNDKMWLTKHFEVCKQFAFNDLILMKTVGGQCFPPSYNIYNWFIETYNGLFKNNLNDVVRDLAHTLQTDENDANIKIEMHEIIGIFQWLRSYYGKELMRNAKLRIDTQNLMPLLDENITEKMELLYLNDTKDKFFGWTKRALEKDLVTWYCNESPLMDEDNCYLTKLPMQIFEIFEQFLQVVTPINSSITAGMLNMISEHLIIFLQQYKDYMKTFAEKHQSNRLENTQYFNYVIANINNLITIKNSADHMITCYKKNDKKRFSVIGQFDEFIISIQNCADTWIYYLFKDVELDLHPSFSNLYFRKAWFGQIVIINTIILTLEDYYRDLLLVRPFFIEKINTCMEKMILENLQAALFSKRIVLNSNIEREAFGKQLNEEFQKLDECLSKCSGNMLPIDPTIQMYQLMTQIISFEDTSLLSFEVQNVYSRYPQQIKRIGCDKLVDFISIRGDVSREEAKEIVIEVLDNGK